MADDPDAKSDDSQAPTAPAGAITANTGSGGDIINQLLARQGPAPQVDTSQQQANIAQRRQMILDLQSNDRSKIDIPTSAPPRQPPPPTYAQSDPMNAFGSFGMLIASLASMRSKQPMTAALNSAAEGMKAYQAKDEEAYKFHYQQWQDNTNLALQANKDLQSQYKLILDNKKLTNQEAISQISALAAADGDENMRLQIQARGLQGAAEINAGLIKAGEEAKTAQQRLEEQYNYHTEIVRQTDEKLKNSPVQQQVFRTFMKTIRQRPGETPEAFGDRQAQAGLDFLKQMKPTPAAEQRKQALAQETSGSIDKAIGILDQAMSGEKEAVTGLHGKVNYWKDWLAGAVTGGDGKPTNAAQFQGIIRQLQATVPSLLGERATAADRAHIDQWISGLGAGNDPANVKENLKNIKQLIERVGSRDAGSAAAGGEAGAASGPAAPANPPESVIKDNQGRSWWTVPAGTQGAVQTPDGRWMAHS